MSNKLKCKIIRRLLLLLAVIWVLPTKASTPALRDTGRISLSCKDYTNSLKNKGKADTLSIQKQIDQLAAYPYTRLSTQTKLSSLMHRYFSGQKVTLSELKLDTICSASDLYPTFKKLLDHIESHQDVSTLRMQFTNVFLEMSQKELSHPLPFGHFVSFAQIIFSLEKAGELKTTPHQKRAFVSIEKRLLPLKQRNQKETELLTEERKSGLGKLSPKDRKRLIDTFMAELIGSNQLRIELHTIVSELKEPA